MLTPSSFTIFHALIPIDKKLHELEAVIIIIITPLFHWPIQLVCLFGCFLVYYRLFSVLKI